MAGGQSDNCYNTHTVPACGPIHKTNELHTIGTATGSGGGSASAGSIARSCASRSALSHSASNACDDWQSQPSA